MKKLLVTATATLACMAALAQGKIGFTTDGNHLVYYDSSVTDPNLAGHTVSSSRMPAGTSLVADLYMGTSSSALSLYSTTTFGAIPGAWSTASVQATSPFIGGGTQVFVEAQVRDTNGTPSSIFTGTIPAGSTYYGKSVLFQFTLGGGITYPPMYGPSGNWPVGSQNLDGVDGNPVGSRGAIGVGVIPEPASMALCGLGAAALLIFRRRK